MYYAIQGDPKRTLEENLMGAIRIYQERFGRKPGLVLTHPEQTIQYADILILPGTERGCVVGKWQLWMGLS